MKKYANKVKTRAANLANKVKNRAVEYKSAVETAYRLGYKLGYENGRKVPDSLGCSVSAASGFKNGVSDYKKSERIKGNVKRRNVNSSY